VHAGGALKLPAAAPIAGSMGDLLAFAGYAVLGLVVVATLVAGWELLLQQAATARLRAAVDTDGFVAAPGPAPSAAQSMPAPGTARTSDTTDTTTGTTCTAATRGTTAAPVAERVTTPAEPAPRITVDGPGWAETAPMTGMGSEPAFAETMPAELHHFAETLPAELVPGDPPAPAGKTPQPA
jgi:hypothetical protein